MSGKLVCGVGLYERGKFKARENGRDTKWYSLWSSMLNRCYSPRQQEWHPTYTGCIVCPEWLDFQVFAGWCEASYPCDGESHQLDKDLKVLGNKIYSPGACLFVSRSVNIFATDCGAARGDLLIGASWDKRANKYQANCRNPFTKKQEYLGLFTDELSAHLAWRKRKSELAYQLAMTQANPEVRDALLRWKSALDNNEIHTV